MSMIPDVFLQLIVGRIPSLLDILTGIQSNQIMYTIQIANTI